MRLIYLVVGLGILLWVIYTYQGSNSALKTDGDTTVKQQAAEQLRQAQEAADALQKSINEQAKRLQQPSE